VPQELFDILSNHAFDGNHCFLCGITLNTDNRTDEHVFPGWLQDALNIRDKTIVLLNRTTIPYRSLVISCCQKCNGTHLSQLENRIRSVVLDPTRTLDELSDEDLTRWLSKIYIGLHWKELGLRSDLRQISSAPILDKRAFENMRTMHFFLQSTRKEMKFIGMDGTFPGSIIRVRCKFSSSDQFDYHDNFFAHTAAIRIRDKGVIAIFDGGWHNYNFPDFRSSHFLDRQLHPMQFSEIFAKVTYKSSLCRRIPFYSISQNVETDEYLVALLAFDDENKGAGCIVVGTENGPIGMIPILSEEIDNSPAYYEWCQEEYAHGLAVYTKVPFDSLFVPPDLVRTMLQKDDGTFQDIPLAE